KKIGLLAWTGGFLDSIGGGGWGPIVNSTLIASGRHPRYTIGSVNLAEFFVSFASSVVFALYVGLDQYGLVILGLILGGSIAAPIAAHLAQKLPVKTMMVLVGIVVIIVSLRKILLFF
ncbi:MAG TPA: TSUP family transporter, partial [Fibrella sp.]